MSDFVNNLSRLAQTVGTMLGGPIVPAVVEIGKDLLGLIDKAKAVVDENDVTKLDAIRDELEPKVMKHADDTEARLRGQS